MNNALFVEPGSNPKRMQELAEDNFQKSQNGHNAIIIYLLVNCLTISMVKSVHKMLQLHLIFPVIRFSHLIFDAVSFI